MQISAGKILTSVFCDAHDILSIHYLKKERTINSEYSMTLLVRLKEEIAKKRSQMKKKRVRLNLLKIVYLLLVWLKNSSYIQGEAHEVLQSDST